MAEVYVSAVIDAAADTVWRTVRDFNGLPDWHPIVAGSRIEEGRPSDQIGCVRAFQLHDGSSIREQLLALSDYCLLYTSPSPRDATLSRMPSSA